VHGHGVLMLAAVAVIAAFLPIVAIVTTLQRRGRLGNPERRLPFRSYGPVLAATFTAGAAAVHLGLIGEHATLALGAGATRAAGTAAAGGLVGAAAFVCSVGAGSTHFASVDASIGGFLPLGVASLGLAPIHALWSIPRLWRHFAGAVAGMLIAAAVLVIGLLPLSAGAAGGTPAGATSPALGYADVLGVVLDLALVVVFVLLVTGRPRRALDRLEVRVVDAWVGTGLGIAAVAIFAAVAIATGHGVH
jgi:hypothetical protein